MRTANVVKGALRAATSAALSAALLLSARGAAASSSYPGDLATNLGLSKAPGCTVCHDNASGGSGTANKPFAKSMKDASLTGGSNAASVKTAIDSLKANGIDSDGDGTPAVDGLVAGTDPNAAGAGAGGPSPAAPDPSFGCPAAIAPSRSTSRGSWLSIALVGAAVVAVARRRRAGGASRRARLTMVPLVSAAILATGACYETSFVSTSVCSSGLEWTGGDTGSPDMYPGQACIGCHRQDDGPLFTIAGTVYEKLAEADSCIGTRAPVKVIITDADKKSIAIETNEAGNFYSRVAVKMPYTAMVVANGKQNVMKGEHSNGDCNACHTAAGAGKAPGRITLP